MTVSPTVESTDAELIAAVLNGDAAVFATARRYARRESEVEDIVQEVFLKAYQKLRSFRGDAPFEHWLMRLAIHTCYDFLRAHQRNRETPFTEISDGESDWLERFAVDPSSASEHTSAARDLIDHVLDQLSPSARLVITLLELEDRSLKEIADLTGWSIAAIKVRAFRARMEMRNCLKKLDRNKYL
jgi:RNA polymerase sigma-70 factor, ECF subfamily